MVPVITGQQLRRARERRGWTQEELAAQLGVTFRSVGNWERGEVPANRQERIRHVLGGDLEEDPDQSGNPLASYSNLALAGELLRRLGTAERREPSDDRQSEAEKMRASTQDDMTLAARRGASTGRAQWERAQTLGEESQDDGGMEPA